MKVLIEIKKSVPLTIFLQWQKLTKIVWSISVAVQQKLAEIELHSFEIVLQCSVTKKINFFASSVIMSFIYDL